MAQVTNFSSEPILVSWIETGPGSPRKTMILDPGNQTINKEIVAVSSNEATIFDRDGWWKLHPWTPTGADFEVVVHNESGFFFKNLSF